MVDISNRALALLLVAAVVVSLGSTVVSLNKLDSMSITGFSVQQATTNLTIEGSIAIEFLVDTINFGTGYTIDSSGTGATTCDLATDGATNTSGDCFGFTLAPPPFELRNIGNQVVDLDLASNATAAQFITGGGSVTPDPRFAFKLRNKEGGSCTGTLTSTYTNFTGGLTDQSACTVFQFAPANDELYIDLLLNITTDAEPGARTAIVRATAS